jgi:hypothetical protein
VAEARSSVAAEAAKRDVTAAKKFNTLLDAGIKKKAAAVKKKREQAAKDKPTLNKGALIAAKSAMDKWDANILVEVEDENGVKQKVPIKETTSLKTPQEWRDFVMALSKNKGVSIEDAQKAAAVMRAKLEKKRGETQKKFDKLNEKWKSAPARNMVR